MRKANDAALKAYPKRKDGRLRNYSCTDDDVRKLYAQGYRKAEKDLALTWEDVRTLFKIADDYEDDAIEKPPYLSQEYCEEVLSRFNEQKK